MNKAECPRVALRMECPECGYPYSEARFPLDERLPHFKTELEDLLEEELFEFAEKLATELGVLPMYLSNCTTLTEMLIAKDNIVTPSNITGNLNTGGAT